jgi:hypothetical protein
MMAISGLVGPERMLDLLPVVLLVVLARTAVWQIPRFGWDQWDQHLCDSRQTKALRRKTLFQVDPWVIIFVPLWVQDFVVKTVTRFETTVTAPIITLAILW